jgi:dienelactone hydrolase
MLFQIRTPFVFQLVFACALSHACLARGEDRIAPSDKLPTTSPWDLQQLSQQPDVQWLDKDSTVRSLMYAGEPYNGKPTSVFAYYATPGTLAGDQAVDKDLPAVVLVHGGGGTAFREWAELWAKRGYAAIAMDLAGYQPINGENAHDPKNRKRLPDGGPDQNDEEKFGSVDKQPGEQWPYHAVANVIRAHSLIRSFPDVDAKRTAVTGISWGGYLTCIVAGVDSRFKAAVPVYGCGFLHENSYWLEPRFQKMSAEQRDRWVTLWDPSRYLPAVSMPILFVNGTNDFAYPLDSYMKSFDAVPSEKQLCVTVNMPHGHHSGWEPKEIGIFIDNVLKQTDGLPIVGEPAIEGVQAKLVANSPRPLKSAAIHWTTDHTPINQRKWQTAAATIDNENVSAPAPPAEATAWFLTVTDDRDAIVSSRTKFAAK